MPEVYSAGRENEAEFVRYPFADDATLVTSSGLAFDADAIADAIFYIPGSSAGVRIDSVTRTPATVTLSFGDRVSAGLASATFDPAAAPQAIPVIAAGRGAGLLVVDPTRISGLQAWPVGVHAFPVGAAEFVASCVVPVVRTAGVASVIVGGVPLAGDVWFFGRDGVVLSADGSTIRIDLAGNPLWARAECADGFTPVSLLRTFTVSGPDGESNVIGPDQFRAVSVFVSDVYAAHTALRVASGGPSEIKIGVAGKPLVDRKTN